MLHGDEAKELGAKAALVFFCGADAGEELEGKTDEEATKWGHSMVRRSMVGHEELGSKGVEEPVKSVVTRWRADPFSRGSYA